MLYLWGNIRGINSYVLRRGGGGDRMARGCRLTKSSLASASDFIFIEGALCVSVSRFYIPLSISFCRFSAIFQNNAVAPAAQLVTS